MPTPTSEYREFFLRENQETSGSKPDQEANFPTKYKVRGKDVFNRFLRNHFPSEEVMKKFLQSIAFKLNQEDTATTSVQGLIKKSSDADAEVRTLNPGTEMAKAVAPHQLPEIVLSTDGSDTAGTVVKEDGISVTPVKRVLSGLFRRNYKLAILFGGSIVADSTSKKLRLEGEDDTTPPGNSMFYGTDDAGAKAWYAQAPVPVVKQLKANFDSSSTSTAVIGAGGNLFRANLVNTKAYQFEIILYTDLDSTGGAKVELDGTAGFASPLYVQVEYADNTSLATEYANVGLGIPTADNFAGFTKGVIRITGTLTCNGNGTLDVKFGQSSASGTSTIKAGSYMIVREASQ